MHRQGSALASWPAFSALLRNGAAAKCGIGALAAAATALGPLLETVHNSAASPHLQLLTSTPESASVISTAATGPQPSSTPHLGNPACPLLSTAPSRRKTAVPWPLRSPSQCFSFPHQLQPTRGFSTSAAEGPGGADAGGGASSGVPTGAGTAGGPGPSETRMSLGEALNQLVDAAIEKVEAGQMDDAVALLKEGLITFEPIFPNSPELGELHNQAALLLLFQGKADEAATHAQVSLETTQRHFGATSVLSAHRLLRLGVVRFAQKKLADAAGLLREAHGLLGGSGPTSADPGSRSEAGFYLDCVALAHVRDASGVEALGPSLRENVRGLKEAYGPDSMILSLALSQHNRLVNGGLEQSDFPVGEALLKQHISVLTEAAGPDSEDVAVAQYKLATYYYANDMLQDAGAAVRQAAVVLRAHYPDEHDMLVLCKHRLGMICAAQGDHRAASQLLQASRKHFSGEGNESMLAKEADIGLAIAKFRAVDLGSSRRSELQHAALEELRKEIETLAEAIGHGHMLVQGATRYYGQFFKLAR